jgi:vacuolar-type H+-ATPase subunit I/STV1
MGPVDTRAHYDTPPSANVGGNARITGVFGAAIFVLLFVEGLTIFRIEQLMWLHVFVGVLLIVFVTAKIASTTYRFVRYYSGQRDYVSKGPPPTFLRVLGPVVTVTTVAVLGTGIGAVLARDVRWLSVAHKASFVVWFGAMSLHVLGHALETPALAFADLHSARRMEARGASKRIALLVVATVVGILLAMLSLGWADHWRHLRGP